MAANRGRGRPAFKPTPKQRDQVKALRLVGRSIPEIAIAIGISDVTLEKYFAHELREGALQLEAEILYKMQKEAKAGKVTAARYLGERAKSIAMKNADDELRGNQPITAAKPEKLGKKEQQLVEAQNAGSESDWGDDLHPARGNTLN